MNDSRQDLPDVYSHLQSPGSTQDIAVQGARGDSLVNSGSQSEAGSSCSLCQSVLGGSWALIWEKPLALWAASRSSDSGRYRSWCCWALLRLLPRFLGAQSPRDWSQVPALREFIVRRGYQTPGPSQARLRDSSPPKSDRWTHGGLDTGGNWLTVKSRRGRKSSSQLLCCEHARVYKDAWVHVCACACMAVLGDMTTRVGGYRKHKFSNSCSCPAFCLPQFMGSWWRPNPFLPLVMSEGAGADPHHLQRQWASRSHPLQARSFTAFRGWLHIISSVNSTSTAH